jgi:hypothetical protein
MLVALALAACASREALGICEQLRAAGLGTSCSAASPGGASVQASSRAILEVGDSSSSNDSKKMAPTKCQVLTFARGADYEQTVKAFALVSVTMGPHRFGNEAKRVFVQCSPGLPEDKAAAIRAAVEVL